MGGPLAPSAVPALLGVLAWKGRVAGPREGNAETAGANSAIAATLSRLERALRAQVEAYLETSITVLKKYKWAGVLVLCTVWVLNCRESPGFSSSISESVPVPCPGMWRCDRRAPCPRARSSRPTCFQCWPRSRPQRRARRSGSPSVRAPSPGRRDRPSRQVRPRLPRHDLRAPGEP